ncbi:MAG: hypothetical protein M1829_005171 [Trizodia sp. TS-e1964]|nr:MAG: hypothetical protein M1829_005171 [Trizodia sp. TS-e1964]
MPFFRSPAPFRLPAPLEDTYQASFRSTNHQLAIMSSSGSAHPDLGHLVLLVFEAVLEVVCVSLPGYIIAQKGMFDADMQKFVANLNIALFTPCLIFTKLASQLSAEKLTDLAVIPVIFVVQSMISYLCAIGTSRLFGFGKRPRNFVVAMGVFGNSNSLPISLVISLSKTLKGLHWDKIPGDNDNEVAARGILYLLIFQQLGQLVRWSWGYHVLLAPPDKVEDEDQHVNSEIERGQGRYLDEPETEAEPLIRTADEEALDREHEQYLPNGDRSGSDSQTLSDFDSGEQTPITRRQYTSSPASKASSLKGHRKHALLASLEATPTNGNTVFGNGLPEHITSFPSIGPPASGLCENSNGPSQWPRRFIALSKSATSSASSAISRVFSRMFASLPQSFQKFLSATARRVSRIALGTWAFMNPPLWAMLIAIVIASVPSLQALFFTPGTFVNNSITSAIKQSGGVAVPLILVVLGANLARNTSPKESSSNVDDAKVEKKILIASIICRMVLPTIFMAPLLALIAKYVPVSIVDDPIFVIVCFLLTGAPSALQLAQICQLNGVYENVMAKILFQSYVIWILPSTLILVMCALETVQWANR